MLTQKWLGEYSKVNVYGNQAGKGSVELRGA